MILKEGDFVLFVDGEKRYLKRLTRDFSLSVKDKQVKFQDVLGQEVGKVIKGFCLLLPTLEDIILLGFKRKTQIVYPKDSFYIAFKLNLSKEKRLLEFGIGSGASTAVFSQLSGEVWAYEIREDFYKLAKSNWAKFNLCQNVKLQNMDFLTAQLEEGFFDAAFIDVKDPLPYMDKVWKVLKPSAPMGSILPTTNQVSDLLRAIEGSFCDIEVLEISHRYYKINPERLRPQDSMVAHTGYILFARKRI
ncbi:MAG: tRNA (adenine-N1)-methyltransferase [Aquificaceae bacterium]